MRIQNISYCACALLLASLMTVSCVREEMEGGTCFDGELVEVSLDLGVAPLVEMSEVPTKGTAINATTNQEENTITNLWVLQFNGTTDSDKLVYSLYLDEYSSGQKTVYLKPSAVPNRIVFVANTFNQNPGFGLNSTLADIKAMALTVSKESDAAVVDSTTTPGKKFHYPMMSGFTDVTSVVNGMGTITGTVFHNVARADVKIINGKPDSLTITSVTVKSVPDKINYITDSTATYPMVSPITTINYTPTAWSAGEMEGGSESYTRNFSFYLPANTRGTVSNTGQNEKGKGLNAPDNASYLYVTAKYTETNGSQSTMYYTFYLGGNLTTDYNIKPNGHYSYTFEIKGQGSEYRDGRVESEIVDFTKFPLANSYIVNPPKEGEEKNYRVPIKRVIDFWTDEFYEHKNYEEFIISLKDGWIVEVIWSDFDVTGKLILTKDTRGEEIETVNDYFQFKVTSGAKGNCIVGLRKTSETDYLWSWHLWITDYRPDMVTQYQQITPSKHLAYSVPGGNVHQYYNDPFDTGVYSGKVIMDRNLGAADANYHDAGDNFAGSLYYQFGRKDPFPGQRNIYLKGGDTPVPWNNSYLILYNSSEIDGAPANVPYSVNNPMMFINTGDGKVDYWTLDDRYNPDSSKFATLVWQDPKIDTSSVNGWRSKKSIFDPCPPGWKVPLMEVWRSFNASPSSSFPLFTLVGNGRCHNVSLNVGFYPFTGYIDSSNGATTDRGTVARTWSCLNDVSSGYAAMGGHEDQNNNVNPASVRPLSMSRATGCFVRCVQE